MNADEKLIRARSRIVRFYPWFSNLVMRLDLVEVPAGSLPCPTLGTDGRKIYYVREYIESLTNDECEFVLLHEGLHCGFEHHARRNGRDIRKWNIAADHAINLVLSETGLTMPKGGYANPKYTGLTAEEIYNNLPKGGSQFDCLIDGSLTEAENTAWKQALAESFHAALKAGKLSDNAERLIEESLQPKLNWRDILADLIVRSAGQDDFTWKHQSRRGRAVDIYLPGLFAESCKPLAICIDTSGSMSGEILSRVVSEARAAIEQLRPVQTVVICADSEIKSIEILDPANGWKPPKLKGGGGTDFEPAIKKSLDFEPSCIVYLTDLEGPTGLDPGIPVIWCVPDRVSHTPAFGETIIIED